MATIKGKWVFNETLNLSYEPTQNINFISNGEDFIGFGTRDSMGGFATILMYHYEEDGYTVGSDAYSSGDDEDASYGWVREAYRIVDFGETEQTVSDTFYTWFTANATQQAEPTPTDEVTIEYNGAVIASLKAGQSATLHCMGDNVKMLTDIEVNVPEGMGGGSELVEASVTVYNIATNYRLYVYIFSVFQQTVQRNSNRIFDIPIGAVVSFSSPDAVIAGVRNLTVTGEAEIINDTVKIKGDCTISVEPYDAD